MAEAEKPESAAMTDRARKLATLADQAEMLEARVRVAELKLRLKEARQKLQ